MPVAIIIVGIVLIVYNYNAIRKKSIHFEIKDRGKEFKSVLKENKEDLSEYKFELGLLRKNLAESLTEIQEEILDIKKELNMVKNEESIYDNNDVKSDSNEKTIFNEDPLNTLQSDIRELHNKNMDVISEINFDNKRQSVNSNKTEMIYQLINQGKNDEEICHELSIGKGEVLLVRKLFKD